MFCSKKVNQSWPQSCFWRESKDATLFSKVRLPQFHSKYLVDPVNFWAETRETLECLRFLRAKQSRLATSGSTIKRSDFVRACCWKTLFCSRKYFRPSEMKQRWKELSTHFSSNEYWVLYHVILYCTTKDPMYIARIFFRQYFFGFFRWISTLRAYLLETWKFREKKLHDTSKLMTDYCFNQKLRNFILGWEAL